MNDSKHWANTGLPSQKEYFEERYQEYLEQGYSQDEAHHLANRNGNLTLKIEHDNTRK